MAELQNFMLFSNCILVKGWTKSIIYDLQFGRYKVIPTLLHKILSELENDSLRNILNSKEYSTCKKGVQFYLKKLIEEGFGIDTARADWFQKFSMEWDYPGRLMTASVVVTNENFNSMIKLQTILDEMNCQHIEFRMPYGCSHQKINTLLAQCAHSRHRSITLVTKNSNFTREFINDLWSMNKRIRRIIETNCSETLSYFERDKALTVTKSQKEFRDVISTELLKKENFSVNIKLFTEAQYYNTYYNKSVYVDEMGNIKNAPLSEKIYGNMRTVELETIVKGEDFTRLALLKKDNIEGCSICEYRYMCPGQAIYENSRNRTDSFIPCQYNPYTGSWGGVLEFSFNN